MSRSKLILAAAVVLLVALAGAWLWGSSGRREAERGLSVAQLRLDLAEARGSALAARVSLFTLNFGDAARAVQDSKDAAERARKRLEEQGHTGALPHLTTALERLDEAQRLANKVDQSAHNAIAAAVSALDAAADTVPPSPR